MSIYNALVSANRAWYAYCKRRQQNRCGALFGGEGFVKTRLATISRVAMNHSALGRFVDSRDRRANLLGSALWRGADLLLQSAQVRLNAPIMDRPSKCLPGTLSS